MLGDDKRIAAQLDILRARQNEQMKGEGAGSAGVVLSLVGGLDDGNNLTAQRPGEDAPRTGHSGRSLAEAGTQPLRLRQPLVAETGRASEKAITARVLPTVNRLLDHDMI
jgi:hypothetical protein